MLCTELLWSKEFTVELRTVQQLLNIVENISQPLHNIQMKQKSDISVKRSTSGFNLKLGTDEKETAYSNRKILATKCRP